MTDLRLSPLHEVHEKLGASFTAFGDWNMPLKYGRELEEHHAVRTTAGLFDLSHMGEIRVSGNDAGAFLDYALISQLSNIAVHRAKYSMIVAEDGGIIDDLISYRLGEEEFLVVPNAGNAQVVFDELERRAHGFDVAVVNESQETALIAIQGPKAEEILLKIVDTHNAKTLTTMKYYACAPAVVAGFEVLLARTGYTGEDGFELYINNEHALALWHAISEAGQDLGLIPAGLAARDSLRLEAGMPLYGNELSRELTPHDAGLGVLIGKKKEADFVAKDVLLNAQAPKKVLVGIVSDDRRAARSGALLFDAEGTEVGIVTSGQPSPTLGHPIALAYIRRDWATPGTHVHADIRGKRYPFKVVELPFYKRNS
ncbi:glycine cleavage system T protein [Corynebacterium kutscheri]|uniref:Aminomethyltransferase n=1 Tax=Corynebacterium kutscheri TaxID=35755 RepID=A0A0F6R0A0_9CORY|nr:glycine cleavage system aminomethyltransferase GcvT [Corynebacterium kutscheri]AKE41607.1 glycine cleavage system T protein [Corynebacterium kutscheri]VEH09933.1 glycine cleavage system T protein [Corynebacterium kutscheri]